MTSNPLQLQKDVNTIFNLFHNNSHLELLFFFCFFLDTSKANEATSDG